MIELTFKPIGIVHSSFKEPKNVPIQTSASKGTQGTIELYSQYLDGMKDLEGFSHIILLYFFHLACGEALTVKPFLDDQLHGIFATRSPARPNRIGLSIVRLSRIEGNIIHIEDLDILEGTPLLDIKPYVSEFDCIKTERIGWLTNRIIKLNQTRDDGRFCDSQT
jgi:tRNA-Thr(GGU) m(6)t(6)A37 methyltransferase TsaA